MFLVLLRMIHLWCYYRERHVYFNNHSSIYWFDQCPHPINCTLCFTRITEVKWVANEMHVKTRRKELFLDIISNIWTVCDELPLVKLYLHRSGAIHVWRFCVGVCEMCSCTRTSCHAVLLLRPGRLASWRDGLGRMLCRGSAADLLWRRDGDVRPPSVQLTSLSSSNKAKESFWLLQNESWRSEWSTRAPVQTLVSLHRQLPTEGDFQHSTYCNSMWVLREKQDTLRTKQIHSTILN